MIALAMILMQSDAPFRYYGSDPVGTCAEWKIDRKRRTNQFQEGWVLGFVTGRNRYRMGNRDPNPDVAGTAIVDYVDTYCAAHPLDNLVQAALALTKELDARASR